MNKALIAICVIAFLALFLFRLNLEWSNMNNHPGLAYMQSGKSYQTVLLIKDEPQNYSYSSRVIAQDELIGRRVIAMSGDFSSQVSSLKVGDRVVVIGYLEKLTDRQEYLASQHVVGSFAIQEIYRVEYQPNVLEKISELFRSRIAKGCSHLEVEHRGLCEGLLMGEQQNITKQDYEKFKKAQLTHLVVASGSNIAFLMAFLSPMLSRLSIRSRSITICFLCLNYCCATRFEPSILRASVMFALPAIALAKGYRFSSIAIFVTTVFISLCIDPFLLYRAGFWLSLFASGGLIFFSPHIKARLGSELVSSTLAATIAVQPVLIFFFGFKIPILWWASVVGVFVAEPLTTIGMVLIFLISYLSVESFISQTIVSIFQLGTNSILLAADIAITKWGIGLGWLASLVAIIAYNISRKSGTRNVNEQQKRHLHHW